MMTAPRPRVVIIGSGFAGLWAAQILAHSEADVTVLDRNNYHTFFPLLYQVAAAEVAPEDIIYPVRAILRRIPHQHFCLGEMTGLDPAMKRISVNGHSLSYDYLVLSIGSVPHFFSVPGAGEHAYLLRTLE